MSLFLVLVDVHHKEQLLTREEAEKAGSGVMRLIEVAVTKDGVTATRTADIMDKYGDKKNAQLIRGQCMYVGLSVCINTVQDPFEKAQLS